MVASAHNFADGNTLLSFTKTMEHFLALFVDVIPKFAMVKGQLVNETNSLTASRKLIKSHLTKHVQHLYNLSMQYNDLKSLLYSNSGIVLITHLLASHGDRYQNFVICLLRQNIKR